VDVVFLIARILYSALFLGSAMAHLTKTEAMAGYVAAKGIPLAKPLTQLTGVQILLGGLSVLLGVWGDLGSLLLALFLIPTAVLMHGFWKETDPMSRQMEMVQFNKDVALGGAALAFYWVFGHDVGITITHSLF
jgi:uncharacterized membrane protein YphA (DoxX/SURF4 family)